MFDRLRDIDPQTLTPLGIIASLDVLIRGIRNVSLIDAIELVSEWALVGTAISLSSGWIGQSVGELLMWVLFAIAIYLLVPQLLPESVAPLAHDRVLMWLLAVGAVVIAKPLTTVFGSLRTTSTTGVSTGGSGSALLQTVMLFAVSYTAVVSVYLWLGRSEPVLAEQSVFRDLLDQLGDDQRVG